MIRQKYLTNKSAETKQNSQIVINIIPAAVVRAEGGGEEESTEGGVEGERHHC